MTFADTEIEHKTLMAHETCLLCISYEFLDQAGLANTGLAAHIDRVSVASLAAGLNDAGELTQLSASTDEGCTRTLGCTAFLPHAVRRARFRNALQPLRTEIVTVEQSLD